MHSCKHHKVNQILAKDSGGPRLQHGKMYQTLPMEWHSSLMDADSGCMDLRIIERMEMGEWNGMVKTLFFILILIKENKFSIKKEMAHTLLVNGLLGL